MTKETTGGWTKLYNTELHNSYHSSNIIGEENKMGRPCSSDGGGDMYEYIRSTAILSFIAPFNYIQWNDAMIGEQNWTESRKRLSWPNLGVEGLKKTATNLNQYRECRGWHTNGAQVWIGTAPACTFS